MKRFRFPSNLAVHWHYRIKYFSCFLDVWPIFGQTWPQNLSRTTGLVLQCRLHQKLAPQTNSKSISLLLSGPLAFSDSETLSFDICPETFTIRPEGQILAPRTRENLRFPLEGPTTSAPGWRAGWGTRFGTLRVAISGQVRKRNGTILATQRCCLPVADNHTAWPSGGRTEPSAGTLCHGGSRRLH